MSTGGGQQEPSEEELRAAFEEQMRQVKVGDVVLQSVVSVLNVGLRRTGMAVGAEGEQDLDQVRIAIEAVRALLPLLDRIAAEQAAPIRDALSQLEMAYVRARGGDPEQPGGEPGPEPPRPDQPPPGPERPGARPQDREQPARPPSSGRLWIPGQ